MAMLTTKLFVHNGGTTSQDLGAASTTNGVNMPFGSQTIEDMNKTIFVGGSGASAEGTEDEAFFGTHVKEAIAIVKDWKHDKTAK